MRFLAFIVLFAALASCGFQPVYSTGSEASQSSVEISEIPGRSGYELRKALMSELAPGLPGVQNAVLTVELRESLNRINLQADQGAARTDFRASGRYVLDIGDDAISGSVNMETSFSVPTEAFGDITAQVDAANRAMSTLARRIADDIKLQLASRED
ncbi:MAG: hypothetical protein AAFQ67_07970, partial [Pseudomonadota bacterium]